MNDFDKIYCQLILREREREKGRRGNKSAIKRHDSQEIYYIYYAIVNIILKL